MQISKRLTPTTWDFWRIVLTLAAKDIVDALRNKTTLTMLIGVGTLILTVQALPMLLKLDDRPRVAIYDAARSGVADELRRDGGLQVSEIRTAEEARNRAPEASGSLLALALPAGWESSPGTLQVAGYLAPWIGAAEASQLVNEAQRALAAATGRQVIIQTETVYPTLDNGGHNVMVASGLVLVTVLITAILVPYLILEEKANHTLEVLRVSPAGIYQILMGKGMAGFVYGALAAAVLLVFNPAMVNQWGLLLAALAAIILFGVGLGLLVGTLAENEGTVQLWIAMLAVLLMAPLLLTFVDNSRLPAWVTQILAWTPTSAAYDLIRLSFGNTFPAAQIWPSLLALLAAVVLVFGVAGWRLRAWEG